MRLAVQALWRLYSSRMAARTVAGAAALTALTAVLRTLESVV